MRQFVLVALSLGLLANGAAAQSISSGGSPDTSALSAQVQALNAQVQALASAMPSNAAITALAPVQAVNAKTGSVTVPTLCRQQSNATTLPTSNPGMLSWTFPLANNPAGCAFATTPSCWNDISTSTSGWAFDYPLKTSGSTSVVSYAYTAHPTTLSISLGTLNLSVGPPANSTTVLTCTAPPT